MKNHRLSSGLRLSICIFAGSLAVSAALGCSGGSKGSNPNGRPASGTVTYKSTPVEGATVSFISATSSAYGQTDAEGKFKLRAADGENVALGEYQVLVVKKEQLPAQAESSPENYVPPDDNAPPPPEPKDLLPTKYATQQTTPLKETVKADGPNEFTISLED